MNKRMKYSDKPCPRFTTTGAPPLLLKHQFSISTIYLHRVFMPSSHVTGACSRDLICLYQHDASKIAICWNFLQGTCPNTDDTCNLSHDPTAERTPLCMHFANNGRCTRENCLFPRSEEHTSEL